MFNGQDLTGWIADRLRLGHTRPGADRRSPTRGRRAGERGRPLADEGAEVKGIERGRVTEWFVAHTLMRPRGAAAGY